MIKHIQVFNIVVLSANVEIEFLMLNKTINLSTSLFPKRLSHFARRVQCFRLKCAFFKSNCFSFLRQSFLIKILIILNYLSFFLPRKQVVIAITNYDEFNEFPQFFSPDFVKLTVACEQTDQSLY